MNDSLTLNERPEVLTKKKVSPTAAAYHTVTPYLIVKGAAKAIEFYHSVFGASETMRFPGPNGTIVHAEIKIGDSPVMLADEMPGMEFRSASALGGSPVGILLYVEDVDACAAKAVAAGATVVKPVQDQFYGDRSGTFTDPFGHLWTIATHIEDVSPQEMQRRMSQMKPCGAS
jgi:PhnB protein